MNSMNQEKNIIINLNDTEYVIDEKLKNIVETIMRDYDVDDEKKIKMIRTLISVKFNLKVSVSKENKVLDTIMYSLIDEKTVKDILKAGIKKSQKKYYINNKEELKEKYREKYREKAEMLKEYKNLKTQNRILDDVK